MNYGNNQQQHYPNQGYPNQPNQPYPNQGFSNQPNQPYPNQGFQQQPYSNQGFQQQPYPNQGFQQQPYPNQGFQQQSYQPYQPQPQPHHHHQQQQQQYVSSPAYHWEKFSGNIPQGAVYAGDYYIVIRHDLGDGNTVVGKFHTGQKQSYIPNGGKEIPVNHSIEMLVAAPGSKISWVNASHGTIPSGTVGPIGCDNLYVGRAVCPQPENHYTPGKIHPGHKCFYMPWFGKEQKFDQYEALVITSQPSSSYVVTNQQSNVSFTVTTNYTPYHWEKFSGNIPQNAVYAGDYYIVIKHDLGGGNTVVGKFHTGQKQAYIPNGGKEIPVNNNVEMLVAAQGHRAKWVKASHGQVPTGAVGPIGCDGLFVGRAVCPPPESHNTPGKIHPGHKCFYMPWFGKEEKFDQYEALVIVNEPSAPFHWEKFTGNLPHGTVFASDSYAVIRHDQGNGNIVVGKYNTQQRQAYIPNGGKEINVTHNIEVLVAAPGAHIQWVTGGNGSIHNNAVGPIGGDNLYVGRARCPHPENQYTPGKIHPGHRCFYMPWGGKEEKYDNYEVLVIKF